MIGNIVKSIKFFANQWTGFYMITASVMKGLTILQILLIYSSHFNSVSKVIPSSFSLKLDVICTLLKGATRCILKLNRT